MLNWLKYTAVIVLVVSGGLLAEAVFADEEQRRAGKVIEKIVVDPGHGGSDYGVTGPTGLKESELTGALARQLKVSLEKELGVQVFLTREGEENPDLFERTAMVNRLRGQLFISIHAGGFEQGNVSGFGVFYQDYSLQPDLPAPAFRGGVQEEPIQWALAQTRYIIPSRRLAGELNRSLSQALRIKNQGVVGLPLAVLAGASRPAVLVEVGHLTNPNEEKRLKSQRYRDLVVQGLVQGINSYQEWVRERLPD